MQINIRKNATSKINKYLNAATKITLTTKSRDVSGDFESSTRPATAQEVVDWIAAHYSEKIKLNVHTTKTGECTYFEVRGEYHFNDRFVIRLDSPEQLSRIENKAQRLGCEIVGLGELVIKNDKDCLACSDDLSLIENTLDAAIEKTEKLDAATTESEAGQIMAAEFVVKRLEKDVKEVLANVDTKPNIHGELMRIATRLMKLGFNQPDSVRMVKLTTNNIGASVGLSPLFKGV
ncbi:TPA: hypothetical protein P0E18_004484 [Vibrio harveyi]|nr:hypothetical protein [Vibrio harveyi]